MLAARLSSVAVLWLVLGGNGVRPAVAQDLQFEYAVKIVCGFANRPAVAPGRYYTAINIHNPTPKTIGYRRKFVFTEASDVPAKPLPFTSLIKLAADFAVEIDCTNRELRERKFSKGFAVIQSMVELDVVAVYTAGVLGTLSRQWPSSGYRHGRSSNRKFRASCSDESRAPESLRGSVFLALSLGPHSSFSTSNG